MSNVIGRSGVYIFIILKRAREILKIMRVLSRKPRELEKLVANSKQHINPFMMEADII